MLSPNPTQPLKFADACRIAERAVKAAKGPRRRPRVVWNGVTYIPCCRCPAGWNWHPVTNFERMEDGGGRWIRWRSWCLACEIVRKAKYHSYKVAKRGAMDAAIAHLAIRVKDRHSGAKFRRCVCSVAGAVFDVMRPNAPNSRVDCVLPKSAFFSLACNSHPNTNDTDIGSSPDGSSSPRLGENRGPQACRDDTGPSPTPTRRGAALPSDATRATQTRLCGPQPGGRQHAGRSTTGYGTARMTPKPRTGEAGQMGVGLRERDGSEPDRVPADWHAGRMAKFLALCHGATEADYRALQRPKGRKPGWKERRKAVPR